MVGVRAGAAENLVSSLEEVALSDVGPGPLKLSAALSHPSLQLSLGTPLLLCLCSLSAGCWADAGEASLPLEDRGEFCTPEGGDNLCSLQGIHPY